MTKIKFGTDGWRAIIAKDFTVTNVARVTEGTATWLLKNAHQPSVVIGHDCRFGGELFAETAAKVFAHQGIKVFLAKGIASTPMVSLGTVNRKASLGIVITASHNPPEYNGYKLKGSYGGPLGPDKVEEIENIIPEQPSVDVETLNVKDFQDKGLIQYIDLETMYLKHVEANFDLEAIRKSGLSFAYDAMFGAGQNIMRRLFPDITLIHCEENPSFEGQAPEPIHKNLTEFSELIRVSGDIDCGMATDGDADRIGFYDDQGNFVDSHHLILLLIKYLVEKKGFKGKVVTSFSVTPKVRKICKHYGLEQQTVKVGFKYISSVIVSEDVLLGGEESGGIAIKGHIPERDGIWIGLTIWEYMAKSGKSLRELIDEVYAIVGPFACERYDLHLKEDLKNSIVNNCVKGTYHAFDSYKVKRVEDTDGYKYFLSDDEWLMIRASGTEPVLRTYAEAASSKEAFAILDAAKKTLLN